MKRIIFLLTITLAFFACQKDEIKTYDGKDFLYFSKRVDYSTTYWDTLKSFNFFFEPGVEEKIIDLQVTRGGIVPATEDKEFEIQVDVLSGTERSDFELARKHVFPAGAANYKIPVKVFKTAALEEKTFELGIHLLPNDNFSLDLPEIYTGGDTIQRKTMRVQYSDELTAPTIWTQREIYIGYFSKAKFDEFTNLFGFTIEDWTNSGSKLSSSWNNYVISFVNYLNNKIAEGPDAAIKDPDKNSERGYMSIPGYVYYGVVYIPEVVVPTEYPTTPEWEGNE